MSLSSEQYICPKDLHNPLDPKSKVKKSLGIRTVWPFQQKTTTTVVLRVGSRDPQGSVNQRKGVLQTPTIIKFIIIFIIELL